MKPRDHSIGVIYAASLLQGAVFVSFAAASRVFTGELGISATLYGSLYIPMLGTGAVTSLLGTGALRRLGLHPLFAAGLIANVVALLGLALLSRLPGPVVVPSLIGISILFGISAGFTGIALNTGAMRLFPHIRARALAVLHASLGIGATGGPLLFSFWNERGLWEVAPIVLAVAALSLLILSGLHPIEGFERSSEGSTHPWRDVPRRIWSRGATAFLYGVAESTLAAWAILFLTQHRGVSDSDAARALAAFWLCMTVGRLAGTVVLRRVGAISLVLILLTLMGLSFPLITFAEPGLPAIVFYGLAGLACSAVFPILMGLASEETPEHLPQVSAILSAFLLVGLGLGSFSVGPLSSQLPMASVIRLSAVWPLLLIGAVIFLQRRPHPLRS